MGGNATPIGVVFGAGTITNLNNLSGGSITSNSAEAVVAGGGGQILNINNAGTIAGLGNIGGDNWSAGDNGSGIFNDNHIDSITNTGSIYTKEGLI